MRNAALSLATNLAIAEVLQANRTGLFRVMAEPDDRAVNRLRHTARGLGLQWPARATLAEFERSLAPADPTQATFMLAIQRASQGAGYVPFRRRRDTLACRGGRHLRPRDRPTPPPGGPLCGARGPCARQRPAVPPAVAGSFREASRGDGAGRRPGSQIQRAAVDLAESVILRGREGETFAAIVTEVDHRGARIQLCDLPVAARVGGADLDPGDTVEVTLVKADPDLRTVTFGATERT